MSCRTIDVTRQKAVSHLLLTLMMSRSMNLHGKFEREPAIQTPFGIRNRLKWMQLCVLKQQVWTCHTYQEIVAPSSSGFNNSLYIRY